MDSNIELTCHCGNVRLTIEQLPDSVRDCDCPICNRLGALWGDFSADEVNVETEDSTGSYQWSDSESRLHHCRRCGCTTHYFSDNGEGGVDIGINFRMLDRRKLEEIKVV